MATVYSLICEGECNPEINALSREEDRCQRQRHAIGGLAPDTSKLRELLQRIRYTRHRRVDAMTAQCETCSTTRRFGAV